jgi:hypothetical protein
MSLVPGFAKVMVCGALLTANVRTTLGAGVKAPLPACEAVIVQLPTLTKVTVVPATVQTASVDDAYETGRPEEADPTKVKVPIVMSLVPGFANVIVWGAAKAALL